jgi:spore germination cell wall hydrolase CwlJ-like protein
MPSWPIHNKWAEGLEIGVKESNFVNQLIDFPRKHKEFQNFCSKTASAQIKGHKMNIGQFVLHDAARSDKHAREIQLQFLSTYGDKFKEAFFLHQILDYIVWWISPDQANAGFKPEEALQSKHIAKKIGTPTDPQLQKTVEYVKNHINDIANDCKKWHARSILAHQNPHECLETEK